MIPFTLLLLLAYFRFGWSFGRSLGLVGEHLSSCYSSRFVFVFLLVVVVVLSTHTSTVTQLPPLLHLFLSFTTLLPFYHYLR